MQHRTTECSTVQPTALQLLSALLAVAVSTVGVARHPASALGSSSALPWLDAAHLAATIVQQLCITRTDAVAEYDGWLAGTLFA